MARYETVLNLIENGAKEERLDAIGLAQLSYRNSGGETHQHLELKEIK